PTTLGNAPGFDDTPFAEFDRAKLSVRLLPMLLRREVAVDTAELDALRLNLQVDGKGRNNWDDLAAGREAPDPEAAAGKGAAIEVSGVDVSDTTITYSDKQSGDSFVLSDMTMRLGSLSDDGRPVPAKGSFSFDMQPAAISGNIDLDTVASFDLDEGLVVLDGLTIAGVIEGIANSPTRLKFETDGVEVQTKEQRVAFEPLDLTLLGIDMQADVEPFSYAESVQPNAAIKVDAFSPKSLMTLLDIDVPETADPSALSRVIVDAKLAVKTKRIELSDVTIKLDDTTLKGALSVPRTSGGAYGFNLSADQIDLARYMEPSAAPSEGGSSETVPVDIPVDLIRPLNARGDIRVALASLGAMHFENVVLGLQAGKGRLRLHPITSDLFGGRYNGDVRIDAAASVPVLSVDEKIESVNLTDLARAMFEKENITGTISGAFKLRGRGNNMAEVQQSLAGNMSFELNDGAYEGTDIWYELRRARALLKGGEAPTPELPPRTRFSSVNATGVVSDGVMRNDDLVAELPFMRLTGSGNVDLAAATVNYNLTARVLERPDALQGVTEEELEDFTEAVIPLKITGPLSSPSVKPDIEKLLRKQVEEEVKDRLLDKLLGGKKKAPPADGAATDDVPAEGEPEEAAEEESVEDQLKDKLKDLFD
ncbi:MAG: AsmA family protein, partial [Gammaproteobacteria bacterium]|nr:AsmA family protein [Gammaproteobacteria bacterium]